MIVVNVHGVLLPDSDLIPYITYITLNLRTRQPCRTLGINNPLLRPMNVKNRTGCRAGDLGVGHVPLLGDVDAASNKPGLFAQPFPPTDQMPVSSLAWICCFSCTGLQDPIHKKHSSLHLNL